jgi:hypothetical protein
MGERHIPVLSSDGVTYCSPNCGLGCAKAAFDKATADAAALCERMGPGWEPRVWENLGWHWSISKGAAVIYANRGCYSAWINTQTHVAQHHVQFIETAETPEDALGIAVQMARTHIARIQQTLDALLEEKTHG